MSIKGGSTGRYASRDGPALTGYGRAQEGFVKRSPAADNIADQAYIMSRLPLASTAARWSGSTDEENIG